MWSMHMSVSNHVLQTRQASVLHCSQQGLMKVCMSNDQKTRCTDKLMSMDFTQNQPNLMHN